MRDTERGAVLLEVMAALAILAASGVALAGALAAAAAGEESMRRREADMLEADRLLTAMTLLSRGDLDRRIGVRPVGRHRVDVQRPERDLYRIAIADSAAPLAELLVTVVYRSEGGIDAAR